MLFKQYHIMIMKDRESGVRNIRLRGWMMFFLFFVIIGLSAANVFLWDSYRKATALEHQLIEAQRIGQEQSTQILGLSTHIDELASNLHRVERFNGRLKVLMNISNSPSNVSDDYDENGRQVRFSGSPQVFLQHRELFTRQAFSLVSELSSRVLLEEIDQQAIFHFMQENKEVMLTTPSIWPVKGRISSGFGVRNSPFGGSPRFHKGLDIAQKSGTPIVAPAKGVVTFAGWDNAYGNSIRIDHGNNIMTRYAHLSSMSVSVGKQVQRGEVLGAIGTTGRSTGPHLHYEVLVSGVPVNPMRYILD